MIYYEKYKKIVFHTCTGNTNMIEYSLRNSRTKMVYHQMRLAPHLARMVEAATTRYRLGLRYTHVYYTLYFCFLQL